MTGQTFPESAYYITFEHEMSQNYCRWGVERGSRENASGRERERERIRKHEDVTRIAKAE